MEPKERAYSIASAYNVPILLYHGLWTDPSQLLGRSSAEARYWIAANVFEEQVRSLASRGYTAVTLDELATYRTGAVAVKPLVVTFDDGWVSDWSIATPILQRFGWKAEFFVTTGWVGKPGFLTWENLQCVRQAGMGIQSHAVTHPDLTLLSSAEIRSELCVSKSTLEKHLGTTVSFFALPGGSGRLAEVADLARETGYRGVCTSRVGLNPLTRPPFCLHRIPVTHTTTMSQLEGWAQGAGLATLAWRRHAFRVARRFCGTKFYEWAKARLLRLSATS